MRLPPRAVCRWPNGAIPKAYRGRYDPVIPPTFLHGGYNGPEQQAFGLWLYAAV